MLLPLFADSKGRPVSNPMQGLPVADTHAHLDMLEDPALALARSALAGVGFVATVADPTEDAWRTYSDLESWLANAAELIAADAAELASAGFSAAIQVPRVRAIVGAHPHNAKDFSAEAEATLRELASDALTCAIGEIGLDYHYDYSPRDVQRDVFARQLAIACELELPAVVHLREAHDDGEAILREVGIPAAGCILHCYNLGPDLLERFITLGCHVSFAGPVTFKKADDVRESAVLVPADRLLTETDCPFMAPEPFRGIKNEPAFTVFTAARVAAARGEELPPFAEKTFANALALLDREGSR